MRRSVSIAVLTVTLAIGIGTITIGQNSLFAGAPQKPETSEVKIDNFSFGPDTLTVPVGATVTWTKQRILAAAAYCNLLAAAVFTLPVLITGLLAWQWQLEGQRLKGILLLHLVLGCASSLLIWVVWYIHLRAERKHGGVLPSYRLPIEAAGVALVALVGHLGGFLSGVNGPG